MAIRIVRSGIALPGAFGIVVADSAYAPRYKVGDMIEADTTPPSIGDEVICEAVDGRTVIGYLLEISGNELVLADSCHVIQGPNVRITPSKYWRIAGCHLNYAKRAVKNSMNDARRVARRECKEALKYTGIRKYRVMWLKEGKERKSPWFWSNERAHLAREMMAAKYGLSIIYVD